MLTDTLIRKTKPTDKPQKLFDGGGLFLLVQPNGARYWRMKYRTDGREKLLAFGVYPVISLADARQRREDARKLLANGCDPGEMKQAAKAERLAAAAAETVASETFEKVARDWMAWRESRGKTAEATMGKDLWRLTAATCVGTTYAP